MIIDSPIISGSLASTGSLTQIGNVVITGSLSVSGPIKGNITGSADSASFATTSSYAVSASFATTAVTSSYPLAVTGSVLYSINPAAGVPLNPASSNNSIFLGCQAGVCASAANNSNFIGQNAGANATNANISNFIGWGAGELATNANISNFIGLNAGYSASNASNSNFIGTGAGNSATNAGNSVFIGANAGVGATNASLSNFIGQSAGSQAASASYSLLIGYQAGYNAAGGACGIKSNNIIIGTNISLPDGTRDSINLGAIIFATGSYSSNAGNPITCAVGNGKVGINKSLPTYNLDVSGSGNYTNGLTVTGSIVATSITSSLLGTASYAVNANFLDNLDSTSFVYTSSYNVDSSSFSTRVTNTEATASSLVTASGSFSTRVTTLENASSSFAQQSGSNSTRLTNLETTASVLTTASASFAVVSSSFASASGSLSTRTTNLESTASVLTTASASFAIVSQSFSSTSQSVSTRVTIIESSYATTGSNLFSGTQGINSIANAISFTSTASLYTDGGARITKDLYVSGTSYFNNVTIYGTQSVQYITSSQLNIGTNIITVNTDTPTVRYGGLAVYDSGSTGLTGSLLWDSEANHWIYTNPSGSTYSGGMMISGPRASARGCEQGTTSCALMMGQGGDHITSSAIFHYGNATCFYGNTTITSTGVGCFAGAVCASSVASAGTITGTSGAFSSTLSSNSDFTVNTNRFIVNAATGNTSVAGTLNVTGQACASSILSSGTICSTGNTCFGGMSVVASCLGVGTATPNQKLQVYDATVARILVGTNTTFTDPYSGFPAQNISAIQVISSNVGGAQLQLGYTNTCSGCGIGGIHFMTTGTSASEKRGALIASELEASSATNVTANLVFYTNITGTIGERMRIASTGQVCFACTICAPMVLASGCVGIGTTSPYQNLQVYQTGGAGNNYVEGTIQVGGTSSILGAALSYAAQNSGYVNLVNLNTSGGANARISLGFGAISSGLPASTVMTLNQSGYVGIGTCTPTRALDMCGVLRVQTAGSSGAPSIELGVQNQGSGFFAPAANTIAVATNDNERLRITSTGIACFACQVCAPIFASTNYVQIISSGAYTLIGEGVGVNEYGAIDWDSTNNRLRIATQPYAFGASGGQITLTTGGNVGIGTTSPNYKLEVNGTSCFAGNVAIGGTYCAFALNVHGVTYQIGGSVWVQNGYGYVNSGAVSTGLFPLSDCSIQLRIANSAALTINASNNVGIGTTDPQKPLELRTGGTSTTPSQIFAGGISQAIVGGETQIAFSSNISPTTGTPTASELARAGIGFQYVSAALPSEFSIGIQCTNVCNSNVRFFNGCERMRITSGGCVIVNGTSASSIMTIYPAAGSADTLTYRTTGNSAAGALYAYSDVNGPSSGILHNVSITCGGAANRFNSSYSGWTVAFDSRPASDQMTFNYVNTSGTYITRISLAGNGIACFACQVCAPNFLAGTRTLVYGGGIYDNTANGNNIGITFGTTGILPTDGAGNIVNGTKDLGSASARWCTVYTSDLSLSNGIGDYTIVEGENDLFLYNNKQCKVYKFVVQEVCPEIAPAKRSL